MERVGRLFLRQNDCMKRTVKFGSVNSESFDWTAPLEAGEGAWPLAFEFCSLGGCEANLVAMEAS
jgi:hypothetical protein